MRKIDPQWKTTNYGGVSPYLYLLFSTDKVEYPRKTFLPTVFYVGPSIFEPDELTDRSERFLAAELLREKLFRNLGEELPYGIAVEIEKYEEVDGVRRIHAAVIVAKDAHKAIVIGKGGALLKEVGAEARRDMERLFDGKVFLQLWVKVKEGWADDERALRSLGYGDDQ